MLVCTNHIYIHIYIHMIFLNLYTHEYIAPLSILVSECRESCPYFISLLIFHAFLIEHDVHYSRALTARKVPSPVIPKTLIIRDSFVYVLRIYMPLIMMIMMQNCRDYYSTFQPPS